MPEIILYTEQGVEFKRFKDATLGGLDISDNPIISSYVEVIESYDTKEERITEFHGKMLIEVIHGKEG